MVDNENIITEQVSIDEAEMRLDMFVSSVCEDISRSAAQILIQKSNVTVNGKKEVKNYKVKALDCIVIELQEAVEYDAIPEDMDLDIVYEDSHLIVVNKPKDMVVHPAPGNPRGTLVNGILHHCGGELSGINGVVRPGIVHRIDKDTSGLLVIAKDDKTHLGLSEQLQAHAMDRIYHAVVYGNLKNDSGRIDAPIGRSQNDRKKMCVTNKNARNAATNYTVIERYKGFTHVKLKLETGRTHQIRVHMAYIGHPVAGDTAYGPQKAITTLHGQCLHAQTLGFVHPITGEHMVFESELPEYFMEFISKIR